MSSAKICLGYAILCLGFLPLIRATYYCRELHVRRARMHRTIQPAGVGAGGHNAGVTVRVDPTFCFTADVLPPIRAIRLRITLRQGRWEHRRTQHHLPLHHNAACFLVQKGLVNWRIQRRAGKPPAKQPIGVSLFEMTVISGASQDQIIRHRQVGDFHHHADSANAIQQINNFGPFKVCHGCGRK